MTEELVPLDYLLNPKQFEKTFFIKENYANLRQIALDGYLGLLHNRFISWRIFLGIFPEHESVENWILITQKLREDYATLKEIHGKPPVKDLDPLIFNPLSSNPDNPWNNYHEDFQLRQTIRQDVERAYQDRLLFQMEPIKEIMTNALFTWCKLNPKISYKQGMHELLGLVLFVVYSEQAQGILEISDDAAQCLNILNDPNYIEADTYWIFKRIMELGMMEMFQPVVSNKPNNKKDKLFAWEAEKNDLVNQDKSNEENASPILKRCHKIHHRLLKAIDRDLYNHLEEEKIEPQIYLQRYIRCMLSRELSFPNTIIVWDSIFACIGSDYPNESEAITGKLDFVSHLGLLDLVCVAMIIFVKDFLMANDSTGIMRRLLKFPPVGEIYVIIRMALSYKEILFDGRLNDPVWPIRPRNKAPEIEEFKHHSLEENFERNEESKEKKQKKINVKNMEKIKKRKNDNEMIKIVHSAMETLYEQIEVSEFSEEKTGRGMELLNHLRAEINKEIKKRQDQLALIK